MKNEIAKPACGNSCLLNTFHQALRLAGTPFGLETTTSDAKIFSPFVLSYLRWCRESLKGFLLWPAEPPEHKTNNDDKPAKNSAMIGHGGIKLFSTSEEVRPN
jgi:hypothetical protein